MLPRQCCKLGVRILEMDQYRYLWQMMCGHIRQDIGIHYLVMYGSSTAFRSMANSSQQYLSDDSDQDELTYFTSAAPSSHSYSPSRSRRRRPSRSLSPPSPKKSQVPKHQLTLKRPDALLEVISQEWTKEGAWGVWKGSNVTFVYTFLAKTIETWSKGVLSALLNVPDPGIMVGLGASTDVIDTQYPWASLAVAVGASVAAGLILAPLDLIRTKSVFISPWNISSNYF